jgi:hypothetical protein
MMDRHNTDAPPEAAHRTADIPLTEAGFERALRRVLADEQLRKEFWAAGYSELEQHAGTNVAQWLGRRIVNIIVTAAVAGLLSWLVFSGRIK